MAKDLAHSRCSMNRKGGNCWYQVVVMKRGGARRGCGLGGVAGC